MSHIWDKSKNSVSFPVRKCFYKKRKNYTKTFVRIAQLIQTLISAIIKKRTNVLVNGGVHMNDEETRKELHELIDQIKDAETISFIYKIVVRLVD